MDSLAEIYDAYREDPGFDHLRTTGIVLVPGEGASSNARVLIVGEAPGATENTAGRPFVGASGSVLRSLIVDVAMLRGKDYFITNTVKYRPPGNRTPTWQEVAHSMPYLRAEFKAIGSPNVIVAVGSTAYGAFRPDPGRPGILTSAGKPQPIERGYLVPMIHPAYGLRNKSIRPLMEEHWDRFGHWFREEYGV
jgi:DNA polymerase